MTRIRLGVSEAVITSKPITGQRNVQRMSEAGLVLTGAAVIHSGNTTYGLGDLADISVMHELGSRVRFSGTVIAVVLG